MINNEILTINLIKMKNQKERLKEAIITYLNYDLLADTKFNDPSPDNEAHHKRVKKDAERISKIAFRILIDNK